MEQSKLDKRIRQEMRAIVKLVNEIQKIKDEKHNVKRSN